MQLEERQKKLGLPDTPHPLKLNLKLKIKRRIFLIIPKFVIGERFPSFGGSGEKFGYFEANFNFLFMNV
jgi:hypothetical protein